MSDDWRIGRVDEIRALIDDPDGLFNASLDAPVGRSIDLREDDELDADAFKRLIREAVRVNRR